MGWHEDNEAMTKRLAMRDIMAPLTERIGGARGITSSQRNAAAGIYNNLIDNETQRALGANTLDLAKKKLGLEQQQFGLNEKEFGAKYGPVNTTGLSSLLSDRKSGFGMFPRSTTDLIDYFWRNQ
jgi:hypothetical protein